MTKTSIKVSRQEIQALAYAKAQNGGKFGPRFDYGLYLNRDAVNQIIAAQTRGQHFGFVTT